MKLHDLSPKPGARHRRKRVGRGESSGSGKTCGRGGKGQTARTGGKVAMHFEGGQMPLYRRIPKIGFRARVRYTGRNQYTLVSLSFLDKFDAGADVSPESIEKKGLNLSRKTGAGYKVVATGSISKPIKLKLHAVTSAAKTKIEAAGGSVEIMEAR